MIPGLELRDIVTIATGIVTLSGVIWGLRAAVSKLEVSQAETLRLLSALHRRQDKNDEDIGSLRTNQAVLMERIRGMRETQRFRLGPKHQDMFNGSDDA